MLSLAEGIAARLPMPLESMPRAFGILGASSGLNQPSSGALTRKRWTPRNPSLLEDLTAGDYPAVAH
jgi:hypothetical protein